MAYLKIPDALISIGEPVKKEILDQIQINQEDFNTSIQALEQTSTFDVFDVKFGGSFGDYSTAELEQFYPVLKAPVGVTLTSFVITLLTASTSGTLGLQIQRSTDNGINWTPLLTSPVTVTGTSIGSISGTVNWDITDINQNELLRVVIDSLHLDQGDFHVSVYGSLS